MYCTGYSTVVVYSIYSSSKMIQYSTVVLLYDYHTDSTGTVPAVL